MRKKITYTNEPLGDIEVVLDFLPPPAELAFREEGVKVTLALSKKSVDFNFQWHITMEKWHGKAREEHGLPLVRR